MANPWGNEQENNEQLIVKHSILCMCAICDNLFNFFPVIEPVFFYMEYDGTECRKLTFLKLCRLRTVYWL